MKKITQIFFVVIVLALLASLSVLTVFFPQTRPNEYDVWENRNLADKPSLSASTIFDGSYFSALENFLADHLYGRASILTLNVRYQLFKNNPSVNDIIITDSVLLRDNGIYDRYDTTYLEASDTVANRLRSASDATQEIGGVFLFVGIPTQRMIFANEYPSYMNNDTEYMSNITAHFSAALDAHNINTLFLQNALQASGIPMTQLYSPIDHHFTLTGAYLCCEQVIQELNNLGCNVPMLPEDINFEALSNPMLGTYNRKLYGCTDITGQLLIYGTKASVPYERWDNGIKTDAPIFELGKTTTEYVTYSVYMGGDKAETIIKTNRPSLSKLLIVGDSFTNAMETMLYLSFDEMRSLDYRYYTEKSLTSYIAEYQPDIVLFIRDASVYTSVDGNGNVE